MKITKKIEEKFSGMLLRDYLRQELELSRRTIIHLKSNSQALLINRMPITLRYTLKNNDELSIVFPPEPRGNSMVPEQIPLHIVYEDEMILVIDKRAEMASMPSQTHRSGTLANALLGYYDKVGINSTVHIVTRLDRGTSGLVLVAKHKHIHSLLARQQQEQLIKRKYLAVVEGRMVRKEGIINAPIGRAKDSIIKRCVDESGQEAITHYKVIRETNKYSLLEIELKTGRTHQIRVHFASLGHPLAGDDLYGGTKDVLTRQALHCYKLSFTHPMTKQYLAFDLTVPSEFENLL